MKNIYSTQAGRHQLVFELLRAGQSRQDIADLTGLTVAGVSKIVERLEKCDLLIVSKDSTRRGPSKKYTIKADGAYSGAIIVTRFKIQAAVMDLQGNILKELTTSLSDSSPDFTLNMIWQQIHQLIEYDVNIRDRFLGIGIGLPYPAVFDKDSLYIDPPLWSGWDKIDIKKRLKEQGLPCPIFFENDSNCVALAENWFGVGKGLLSRSEDTCLVSTYIGERGFGSGITINGRPYHGVNGGAGEIGLLAIINEDGYQFPGYYDFGTLTDKVLEEFGQKLANLFLAIKLMLAPNIISLNTLLEKEQFSILKAAIESHYDELLSAIVQKFQLNSVPPAYRLLLTPSELGQEANLIGAATLPILMDLGAWSVKRSSQA